MATLSRFDRPNMTKTLHLMGFVLSIMFICNKTFAEESTITAQKLTIGAELIDKKRLTISAPFSKSQSDFWVAYELVAVSPDKNNQGAIVLDAMPEMVAVSVNEEFVRFSTSQMAASSSNESMKKSIKEQMGNRTEEEIKSALGDTYPAYKALLDDTGKIFTKTIIRRYSTPKEYLNMLISIEKMENLTPLSLNVTIGQGSPPAKLQAAANSSGPNYEKIISGLLIALFCYWLVKRSQK